MGGKSRKTGGISRQLVQRIKREKEKEKEGNPPGEESGKKEPVKKKSFIDWSRWE